jgi:HrpA-like RNA helicase
MIENNQVTIIKGEPGCGKSTRVPNFIMKKWSQIGKGGECNVYVTQPRRISALTLAHRVANERSEEVYKRMKFILHFFFKNGLF